MEGVVFNRTKVELFSSMPEMDSPAVLEMFQKSLLPLFFKYLPFAVAVIVSWIALNMFYFKNNDESSGKKSKTLLFFCQFAQFEIFFTSNGQVLFFCA